LPLSDLIGLGFWTSQTSYIFEWLTGRPAINETKKLYLSYPARRTKMSAKWRRRRELLNALGFGVGLLVRLTDVGCGDLPVVAVGEKTHAARIAP